MIRGGFLTEEDRGKLVALFGRWIELSGSRRCVGARWLGGVAGDSAGQRLGAVDGRTIRGWHKLFEQRGIEGLTSFDMGGSAESPDAEWLRRLASARGFGRAHALFPDTVAAAYARGSQAMSTLPTTFLALTEPAVTFDPAAFDSAAFTVPE